MEKDEINIAFNRHGHEIEESHGTPYHQRACLSERKYFKMVPTFGIVPTTMWYLAGSD